MELDDFLAGERAEGRKVSEDSSFTLDPAQVRSRVATFCDQERLYPLYRCLQGILRVSESDLFLRSDKVGWVASFRWDAIPLGKQFRGFLTEGAREGFDHVPHAAAQHFFFGLSAALGVPHYRLDLITPQGGFKIQNGKLELSQETSPEYCQLSFTIDAPWLARLTGGSRWKAETEAELRSRLAYSPVPVHIEGQRLLPTVPTPPDKPWASRISQGSNLAWRYLVSPTGGSFQPPEVPLDRYRVGKKGKVWHLIKDDPTTPLPLSVQFCDAPAPEKLPLIPDRVFASGASDQGGAPLCRSALFLSLQAGRQDWLLPVRDGLLGEPLAIDVAKGGILVVAADDDLRYDLSGLRLVKDARLEEKLVLWRGEAKALKSQLRVSLANIGLRAEAMPSQYDQASGYVLGGPFAGMLGGTLGPMVRQLLNKRKERG